MIRRLIVLLLLAMAAPATAAPAAWVLRDADTEITLFGTFHALPAGTVWLSPAIADRLAAADTLVVETVIPDDPLALGETLARLGTRPGLKPILTRVSPATAGQISAAAAAARLSIAALDRMESWLAAITLSQATLTAVGLTSASGVEPTLLQRARTTNKAVIGLETPEQQLGFFDSLPEADQVAMLEASAADLANARAETDQLIALWQAGDVDTIARDFAREARASPLLAKVLITDRNRRWATWIAGVMRRPGKVFIAVGAGHLGGPDGLLALLRTSGLTPEPLAAAPTP